MDKKMRKFLRQLHISFLPFDITIWPGLWWLSIFSIEVGDWDGNLLLIENNQGCWKFELLWTREVIGKIKDWWKERGEKK